MRFVRGWLTEELYRIFSIVRIYSVWLNVKFSSTNLPKPFKCIFSGINMVGVNIFLTNPFNNYPIEWTVSLSSFW
jgi:hypothetical protein